MASDAARSHGRSCRRPRRTPHRPAPSAHRSPASARCGVGCGATRGLRSPASRGARPGRSWRLSGPEPSMTCGHKLGGRARHRAPACRAGRRRACGLTGSRGASLTTGRGPDVPLASTHAQEPIATGPRPGACAWTPARASNPQTTRTAGDGVLPLTRPGSSRAPADVAPLRCGGRQEGPERWLGRRHPSLGSRHAPSP